jgi:RNA polymerase sigma factor (TIGR02999 family)
MTESDRTPASDPGRVTRLLQSWGEGDRQALEELSGLVYADLHRLAESYLRRERPGHTLQPTALIHESFLRLLSGAPKDWEGKAHFYGIAARVMRQVLVEHARRHRAGKRGGSAVRVSLDEGIAAAPGRVVDFEDLDEALADLGRLDERQARIVELRFFAGLGIEETAASLGLSPATVKREWATARAWLHRRLGEAGEAR